MEDLFNNVIIQNPDRPYYGVPQNISLNKMLRNGWFVSAVFSNSAWCVKKHKRYFKSKCVNIIFNCDRDLAEKYIERIARKKYLVYKKYLKGK